MKCRVEYALMLALLIAVPATAELVQNGGFENGLTSWTAVNGGGTYRINAGNFQTADPDAEVEVYKYDATWAKLSQALNIPGTSLRFSFQAALAAVELNPAASYWALSAVSLEYRDAAGGYLGRSLVINKSPHCAIASTPTQHLITVADSLWHSYTLNVSDELALLTGVNPALVKKVTVAAFDSSNGC